MNRLLTTKICLLGAIVAMFHQGFSQDNVARDWFNILREAIDDDFGRQGVQARNVYHTALCIHDVWSVFEPEHNSILLGQTMGGFESEFLGYVIPQDSLEKVEAIHLAISHAANHLIKHRFSNSPGFAATNYRCDMLMDEYGYDVEFESMDYINDGPAALGRYVAQQIVDFGLQDGSNQQNDYAYQNYDSPNGALPSFEPGNPTLFFPSRWQRLSFLYFIDSSGNAFPMEEENDTPEWDEVSPFALLPDSIHPLWINNSFTDVWFDPIEPPLMNLVPPFDLASDYKWNMSKVLEWSQDLSHGGLESIDISPGAIGGLELPSPGAETRIFFDQSDIWDLAPGHSVNPANGSSYNSIEVPLGDFGRAIISYWLRSENETHVDHWLLILQDINDHPEFEKRWNGQGDELDDLEWEIRSNLALGAAMHDASIAVLGNKGTWDFVRPVSAIRWMAENGQSSDPLLPSYHQNGLPLIPGLIELIEVGDPLEGADGEHVGKIKVHAWLGPETITNPNVDVAGVGWMLGDFWWPWQRPTFISPPTGGYPSYHTTVSYTAAEILTHISGSEFFPGGCYEFLSEQDMHFSVENGPSEDVPLKWATYHDAAVQCGLSRLWAGVAVPEAITRGAQLGSQIGEINATAQDSISDSQVPLLTDVDLSSTMLNDQNAIDGFELELTFSLPMDTLEIPSILLDTVESLAGIQQQSSSWVSEYTIHFAYTMLDLDQEFDNLWISIHGAKSESGVRQNTHLAPDFFSIDTKNPVVESMTTNTSILNESSVGEGALQFAFAMNEPMSQVGIPQLTLPTEAAASLSQNTTASEWNDNFSFTLHFDLSDADQELFDLQPIELIAFDAAGNASAPIETWPNLILDTKQPEVVDVSSNIYSIIPADVSSSGLSIIAIFDEPMLEDSNPEVHFLYVAPSGEIFPSAENDAWLNPYTFQTTRSILESDEEILGIDVSIENHADLQGNSGETATFDDLLDYTIPTNLVNHDAAETLIYPNPSDGIIIVQSSNVLKRITIYDSKGRMVFESLNPSENQIDISQFAAGILVVETETASNVSRTRVSLVK